MKSAAWKYVLAALLPLVILLYTPALPLFILAFGQEVVLRVVPVDPRDFFRGDYVELDYEVGRLPLSLSGGDGEPERGETLYVSLRPDERGVAEATGISREKPPSGLYIRGDVRASSWVDEQEALVLDYGIGRYYVREGTGLELEEALTNGEVLAVVRILGGRAVLRELRTGE